MRTVRSPLLTVALVLLAGCGGIDAPQAVQPEPTATAMELPDGRTATPEQQAFLDEVLPQLSEANASDVLVVLSEGESVCTVLLEPSSPRGLATGVQLMTQGRWNQTEATVMIRSAAKHFCPDK